MLAPRHDAEKAFKLRTLSLNSKFTKGDISCSFANTKPSDQVLPEIKKEWTSFSEPLMVTSPEAFPLMGNSFKEGKIVFAVSSDAFCHDNDTFTNCPLERSMSPLALRGVLFQREEVSNFTVLPFSIFTFASTSSKVWPMTESFLEERRALPDNSIAIPESLTLTLLTMPDIFPPICGKDFAIRFRSMSLPSKLRSR